MTKYTVRILTAEDLSAYAPAWNSLWERSDVAFPTSRAECILLWKDRFAPNTGFHVVIVESDGRCVAGMPVYRSNKLGPLRTGMPAGNDWSYCGDLLLDRSADTESVLERFFHGLEILPFDVYWIDPVRFERPQWVLFREFMEKTGRKSQWLPRYRTAVLQLDADREALFSTWNKREVGNIDRRIKKWFHSDSCSMQILSDAGEILARLPDCFALEDLGWKGKDGGSILQQGMDGYFLEQARLLSQNDLLRLCLLNFEKETVAFRYCFRAKRTLFSWKTSYAPAHRSKSPGQVLLRMIIDRLLHDAEIDRLDFCGISAPNQMIWNPELQTVGQIVFPNTFRGKMFFSLYDTVMPWLRRRRNGS